jgi:hypothetical protein
MPRILWIAALVAAFLASAVSIGPRASRAIDRDDIVLGH